MMKLVRTFYGDVAHSFGFGGNLSRETYTLIVHPSDGDHAVGIELVFLNKEQLKFFQRFVNASVDEALRPRGHAGFQEP